MSSSDPTPADTKPSFAGRLRSREFLVGTFVKTTSHQTVEVLSRSGLDFLVIDAEHAPFGQESLDRCLMAARGSQIPALVRVPAARNEAAMQALDLGADGLVIPHVDSSEAALAAVRSALYRGGVRGFSNSPRAGGYGQRGFAEHLRLSDAAVAVVCQIEDAAALDQLEAITAVAGLDALFIGRADLALSLGLSSLADPALENAVAKVCETGRRLGVAVGIFLSDATEITAYRAMGVSFFVVGSDQSHMQSGVRAVLASARSV